ncbi:1374_t:CDS:1, partial [Racocetra persica]
TNTNLEPENMEAYTKPEPKNAEANAQDNITNQSLNDSQGYQNVYEEISSD